MIYPIRVDIQSKVINAKSVLKTLKSMHVLIENYRK